MRIIFALMVVVGVTTAIQSPNFGQSGFVTTMIKYAPGDTTCTTPVALTYQPTGICIAASLIAPNTYPTVTPNNAQIITGTITLYSTQYQSYMYSVNQAGNVFVSYFTDNMCSTPVSTSAANALAGVYAADTQTTSTTTCTLVGSFTSGPSAGAGGWLYTTTPMTYSATTPTLAGGSFPMSILNTYANAGGMGSGNSPSCAGMPTSVTLQNVALTQMAPFSSGNTCAKTACSAMSVVGQTNGAANPLLATLPTVTINSQTTCMTPTSSSVTGYYLRNYFTVCFCCHRHSIFVALIFSFLFNEQILIFFRFLFYPSGCQLFHP